MTTQSFHNSSLYWFQSRYLFSYPLAVLKFLFLSTCCLQKKGIIFSLTRCINFWRLTRRKERVAVLFFVWLKILFFLFHLMQGSIRPKRSMGRKGQRYKLNYASFIFIYWLDLPFSCSATSISSTHITLYSKNEYRHNTKSVLIVVSIDPPSPWFLRKGELRETEAGQKQVYCDYPSCAFTPLLPRSQCWLTWI